MIRRKKSHLIKNYRKRNSTKGGPEEATPPNKIKS
jgi:hypothetical protein